MSDSTAFATLASDFHTAVHAATRASVDAEPEAQLTIPFATLLSGVARESGLRPLQFVRETRIDTIRPDFSVLQGTRFAGWAELKAPDITLDGTRWTGAQRRKQWSVLSDLEAVLLCNGRAVRLYTFGEVYGPDAPLPFDSAADWSPGPLMDLLRRFCEMRPLNIRSVTELAKRLALRARDLRDRLTWLLGQESDAAREARNAFTSWQKYVHPSCNEKDFADGLAQVVAYGLVLAKLTTNADANGDGVVQASEARDALKRSSPFMSAAFGPLIENKDLFSAVSVEVAALETLVSAINEEEVKKRAKKGLGETWLYFYEDFLAVYDPEERRQSGVYFTPVAVVSAMVRMVDQILHERFGKRQGFGDAGVVTLDPATGTGTFPLAVIERAAARAAARGPAGLSQAAQNLMRNLFAFELLPGPYAVAQLRLGQQLSAMDETLFGRSPQVILTDTLESPEAQLELGPLFGDIRVLAAEQDRANRIKKEQRVTVVIGNPPYRRVDKENSGRGGGDWVLRGSSTGREGRKSLFDDILDVAKEHTIFSHHASLYNLYVYFWRWAFWKAFEAHGPGPGVVAMITGSSWLTGPGFVGLRKLARELCDEAWVLDLGGDNKGANPEENIFAIETPVAVVVLVRDGESKRGEQAPVHYRRLHGTREEKLAAMQAIADSPEPLAGLWSDGPSGTIVPFVPATGGRAWSEMPYLQDLFPWQQPGCMYNRLWPIAPHRHVLVQRWEKFTAAPPDEKPVLFQTANSGRHIHTVVKGLSKLVDLCAGSPHQPFVRYGYRSFDVQWTYDDPRLAKTDSPALWQSTSPKQLFLASFLTKLLGYGPAMTVTAHVPDKDFFCGRGGKDIIPLYRDATAKQPNIAVGLLDALGTALGGLEPSPEDMAAYVYAVLSAPRYFERFADELRTPGPRVPLTADPLLWNEAVKLGRQMLWLHTYGERFRDPSAGRNRYVPDVDGLGWSDPVRKMPEKSGQIRFVVDEQRLIVGDGCIVGVRPEVWDFSVSGMPVVKKWLGYRTAAGAGRAASSRNPLDAIRMNQWPDDWNDDLLDLLRVLTVTVEQQPSQAELVDRICEGAQISVGQLPKPSAEQRRPPPTIQRFGVEKLLC